MQTNKNYDNLEQSYLFSTIARKVREYSEAHPEADIIRLGIGDVTRPLVPAVINALHAAVEDQAKQETFHGYGDEQGYGFLHEALVGYYKSHGVELATNEIFISDGAKSDLGNILDIFGTDNTVLVPDPVYPVYVDTNVMAGRKRLPAAAGRVRRVRHHLYLLSEQPDRRCLRPRRSEGLGRLRKQAERRYPV